MKAYVRWQKNDLAGAAAICEAVGRPSMRFVAVKSAEQQGVDDAAPGARGSGGPAPGTELSVTLLGEDRKAEVVAEPLYDPANERLRG